MPDSSTREMDWKMDAYLDHLMDQPDREAFEREINQEPALQMQVETQTLIDASLRRVFAPPTDADLPQIPKIASPAVQHWTARPLRPNVAVALASAAMLVMSVGGWWWWNYDDRPKTIAPSYATAGEVYHATVSRGFKARYICRTDRQFATAFNFWLDQPLLPHRPDNVDWIGISRCRINGRQATYILLKVAGRQVIVLVDRVDGPLEELPTVGDDLHVFRRRVNQLVLYEVSPADKSAVLDLFYKPEMPAEWENDIPDW